MSGITFVKSSVFATVLIIAAESGAIAQTRRRLRRLKKNWGATC